MWRRAFVLLLVVLAGAGCALIPPRKLPMDRRNYLEAVCTSWKEQLLTNLIKLRYGDALTTLEMTSINTTYALDSNVTANYPIAWDPLHSTYPQGNWVDGFRNIVTLGGQAIYQDHPSISYTPIRGDALAKTMIEPINPRKVLKSLQTGWLADYIFPCCVKAINDLRNRSSSGSIKADPNFFDLVELFQYLKKYGVLRITVKEEGDSKVTKVPEKFEITLHNIVSGEEPARKAGNQPQKGKETGEATPKKDKGTKDSVIAGGTNDSAKGDGKKNRAIGELVLDIDRAEKMDKNPGDYLTPGDYEDYKKYHYTIKDKIQLFKNLLWPQSASLEKPICGSEVYEIIDGNQNPPQALDCDKIVLQTRSIYETLNMLSMFIDIPAENLPANEHRASPSNLVGKPLNGPVNPKMFTIHYDNSRPSDAFVAVKHGDLWFYIKDTDYDSKDIFTSTEVFLTMFETGTTQGVPVLTLPVQ